MDEMVRNYCRISIILYYYYIEFELAIELSDISRKAFFYYFGLFCSICVITLLDITC